MKSAVRVALPPVRPLVIFDGECNFCVLWARRWEQATRDHVDYLPFQDERVATQFPELARAQLETAVHLVLPDGAVFSGAEAAFRALAHQPHERWLLDWYVHFPVFARSAEWAYRFIARHRRLFSALTRLGWGRHVEPPTYDLVRWVFLRALGLIYVVAFVSLWVQIIGLVGADGILPTKLTMAAVGQQFDTAKVGWGRYHQFPTLCWFSSSDRFLRFQCAAGTALAVLLVLGIAPAPCLFLLWVIYLSLATVGREFLGFQWDNLLLEAGFLAIFLAPLQMLPRLARAPPPSRLVIWLVRWLVFRLMFESGCVKWLSGDPTWHHFTALSYHYETQPLPTWLGWYAYQLPMWFQRVSAVVMFGIELFLPFLILAPRRLRQAACVAFIFLQTLILLTGNYGFFNLLTIALCLVLLDDAALSRFVPPRWRPSRPINPHPGTSHSRIHWPRQFTVPLACVTLAFSLIEFSGIFRVRFPWPRPVLRVYSWLAPFRSLNNYGLFAVMTTSRPEIIVEGSNDGVTWREYSFKYKPGDLNRRPGFVEPHQPRLDWQMWFAALGSYRNNPWFVNFCVRLLQGSPETLALLERNPFPKEPPRYVRAVVYEYRFTDLAARRQTGAWWRREQEGDYLPVMSLK